MCSETYPAGCLDLLAIIIKSPSHDSLGSVLVGGLGVGWELVGGIIEILIISPVRATIKVLEKRPRERVANADGLTLLISTSWRGR